jgi:septum formation protein
VDEDSVKESLLKEKATPTIISKNLAELKANKISQKFTEEIVLGADSVIDLEGEIISKPNDRVEALEILKKDEWKNSSIDKFSLYIKGWIDDMELH